MKRIGIIGYARTILPNSLITSRSKCAILYGVRLVYPRAM